MDRTVLSYPNTTAMPTLAYAAPSYFQSMTPNALTFIKSIFDLDIWKDLGAAMKIRRDFAEKSSLFANEYCRIATTETVVVQAYDWALSPTTPDDVDTKYEGLKEKWKFRLNKQVNEINAGIDKYMRLSASELIYFLLNDKLALSSLDVSSKQRLALCLNYAIWREMEDSIVIELHHGIVNSFVSNMEITDIYEFDQPTTAKFDKFYEIFNRYVESGSTTFTEKLSPWFAVYWILKKYPSIIDNIYDVELKKTIKNLSDKNNADTAFKMTLMTTEKRTHENAFLLNVFSIDLPKDTDKYKKDTVNPDASFMVLAYNVQGVRHWGECLDRTYLLEKTINSFIGQSIMSGKNKIHSILVETLGQGLVNSPQKYTMEKLHTVERDLIKVGVTQISESLQSEFKNLFSPTHMAEGTVPIALTIFIHSEMMRMGIHYAPTQVQPVVRRIVQGLFPLVLASTAKITGIVVSAYERRSKVS